MRLIRGKHQSFSKIAGFLCHHIPVPAEQKTVVAKKTGDFGNLRSPVTDEAVRLS
jgi:hypothetical protein